MKNQKLTIFIGFDPVESVAFHTLVHSILTYSSRPVNIIPLNIKNLGNEFFRERDAKQSNEFSFTRFLVPYIMEYQGWAIFMDCDMMLREDIYNVFDDIIDDSQKAVYVVKHDYTAEEGLKYLNTVQYSYPRKNWSSFVLWNCSHEANKRVTKEWVNTASGLELHRFTWLDDSQIGDLNIRWNWLVGDYINPPINVANVHWTLGGPYFNEFRNVDFCEEWFEMYEKMKNCEQRI
jgi:hypothetical protein